MRRVCFVSLPAYGYFVPERYEMTGGGGAKRQSYLLATGLSDEYDVSVIVGDYSQPAIVHREGVRLIRSYTPGDVSMPVAMRSLIGAMRTADADVYIYRGGPRKAAFIGPIARLLGAEWVYNVASDADLTHRYSSASPLIHRAFPWSLKLARSVIAQTPDQQRRLRSSFGIDATVIPSGYPPAAVDPTKQRETVLWVGRLDREQKRPHLFLEVARNLPDYRFELIGVVDDEPYQDRIKTGCDRLENVDYVGPVPPNEIHEHLSKAVALVNTSAFEGFPNTFLEAWHHETPVVSLSVDPGRYLTDGLFTGFAGDELDQLVDAIARLWDNPNRRARVGRDLREFVEETYHIDDVTSRFADVLD